MRQVNLSMIRDNTGADYRWVRRGLKLETENNKCDKHVFEQGNGFVTVFQPPNIHLGGLLTYRSELTTYVRKPAVLITCKISPYCICLRCPIRRLLYPSYRCVSRSLGGFSSLPPRHVIPCSLFRIVMVKSWGSGSRMVKDKKARIRIPCPFTGWILYPPESNVYG